MRYLPEQAIGLFSRLYYSFLAFFSLVSQKSTENEHQGDV